MNLPSIRYTLQKSADEQLDRWLLSWVLWRSLMRGRHQHPLFERPAAIRRIRRELPLWARGMRLVIAGLLLLVLLVFAVPFPVLLLVTIPGAILLFLGVLIGGTSLGSLSAFGVSQRIADQRERGRYDLLSLAPGGPLGWHWALASRFVRFHPRAWRLRRAVLSFYATSLTVLILLLIGVSLSWLVVIIPNEFNVFGEFYGQLNDLLLLVLNGFAALLLLYLDTVQATASAVLIGLLVPTFTRSRVDAAFFATALFLMLQGLVYLAILVGVFSSTGALFDLLDMEAGFLLSLLRVAGAIALREWIVLMLWQQVERRLNIEPDALNHLIERGAR